MKFTKLLLSLAIIITLSACSTAKRYSPFHESSKPIGTQTGSFKVGAPYKIMGRWYRPEETYNFSQKGIASWYGPKFHGKLTANGEIYNQNALTAAHNTLQMPSIVRVTNLENGRSIIVRVNDRGPFARGRIIDMSKRGAELLQFKNQGTAKVRVQIMPEESRAVAEAAKQGLDVRGVEIALNKGQTVADFLNTSTLPPAQVQIASTAPEPLAPPTTKIITPQTASIPAVETAQPLPSQIAQPSILQEQSFIRSVPVTASPIYVQAGAFKSADNAAALANSLQKFGATSVQPATVNNQVFHRVKIGPIQNVDMADKVLSDMVASGYNNAIIVVE